MSWLSDLIAALLKTKKRPPVPPVPVPVRHALRVEVFDGDPAVDEKVPGARVTLNGSLALETGGSGDAQFEGLKAGVYVLVVAAEGFGVVTVTVLVPTNTPVRVSLTRTRPAFGGRLTADGRIFRQNGQPWRWRGVSAFRLLDRFAHGEDITPQLALYSDLGFNLLRVWVSVDWPAPFGWDRPTAEQTVAFCAAARLYGCTMELTLLTDDAPARIGPAQDLVAALTAARLDNLVLEIGNEPTTNGKSIDTPALKAACAASGYLYASGDYEDSARAFGSYLVCHTGRDPEWPRRAHDLLEYYSGGGPNSPEDPAHRCPIVADEPIRGDQAGFNEQDAYAYAATCSLLGAGQTAHFESGKQATMPTPDEIRWIDAIAKGLNVFPAEAPNGAYGRPVERSLRTYTVGPYMVRIRPETPDAPEPGWTALDDWGICWRRG